MKLPYSHLLREGRIRKHRTNAQEIASLFEVVKRDLADASLPELSPDRRFATAYNAVLQNAKAIMYCQGYRTKGSGHHSTTFEFLGIALGAGFEALADYFDRCRVKRNIADYVGAGSISETEAEDLLEEARAFAQTARAWIETNYPNLAGWKEKR
jgi:uncharacterized protein (UPF0332 family)